MFFLSQLVLLVGQEKCGVEQQSLLHGINITDESYVHSFRNFYEHIDEVRTDLTLYIPVHIIVVHTPGLAIGSGNNHSVEKILEQMQVLNKDFGRTNFDTIFTPKEFKSGNPKIHFCLASIDPDGKPTDGISRYASNSSFQNEEIFIKTSTAWPREDYLNIWVAGITNLGFSYIPNATSLPDSKIDGVTIDHKAFGGNKTNTNKPYNLGRTATHEVGHFLGLQHIWFTDGCIGDDGITDTPLQNRANLGCKSHPSISCQNKGDMYMNYMDYSDDDCLVMFSFDQAKYMRSILSTLRYALLESGRTQCQPITKVVENQNFKNEFKVYPNPVNENLAIEYFGNKNEEVIVEFYDIFGKLISKNDQIILSEEKNIHNFLVNNIENSIFIIKIASKFKSTHFMITKN